MKLYISIPINGRPLHEAKAQAEAIKAKLEPHGHECITPFDVCPEPDKPYAYYMGRDIEALLADDIDGIVFGAGFHDSRGCRLEHSAVRIIYLEQHGKIILPSTDSSSIPMIFKNLIGLNIKDEQYIQYLLNIAFAEMGFISVRIEYWINNKLISIGNIPNINQLPESRSGATS